MDSFTKNRGCTKRGHIFSYDQSAMGIVAGGEVLTILWSRFNNLPPPRALEVVEVLVDPLENTFVLTAQFLGSDREKRGAVYALSPNYLPFSYFSLPFAPAAAETKDGCLAIYPAVGTSPEFFTAKGLKPGEIGKMTAPPSVFFSQPCCMQELSEIRKSPVSQKFSPSPVSPSPVSPSPVSQKFSPKISSSSSPKADSKKITLPLDREEKKKLAASAGRGKGVYSKEDLLKIAGEAGVEVYRSWSKEELVESMRQLWL